MYLQNNRLVSLNALRNFKFLNTLLASNNQIRNLEKQLETLTRLSFLKKLDLFDNPVAEEPDYRLRLIYHVPQVELLDRQGVTAAQRERANETVPNLDRVSAAKAQKDKRKTFQLSVAERDCFREARAIRAKRAQAEEESFRMQTLTRSISHDGKPPKNQLTLANTERWVSQSSLIKEELNQPTPWEKRDMHPHIERMAREQAEPDAGDGSEMRRKDVEALCRTLANKGIEDVGRILDRADVFSTMPAVQEGFSALDSGRDRDIRPDIFRSGFGGENRGASGFGESGMNGLNGLNDVDVTVMAYAQWISEMKQQDVGKTRRKVPKPEISEGAKTHPLNTLISDPDATMPVGVVADFLLTLNWRRFDDDILDRRIEQLYEDARSADLTGDSETLVKSRNLALRLEGVKTRKYEVGLKAVPETGPLRKSRSDVFAQSMLRPSRALDETGRMVIQVSAEGRHTTLCK